MQPELDSVEALVSGLPRPLAVMLDGLIAEEARRVPVLLCHRLLEAGENGCKFWVALAAGVQEELQAGAVGGVGRLVLGSDGPPDGPTFNDWLQALSQALKSRLLYDLGNLEEAARAWERLVRWADPLWSDGERPLPREGVLADLQGPHPGWWVQVRNLLAHTSSLTPRRAEQLLEELLPPFSQALTLAANALRGSEVVGWHQGSPFSVPAGKDEWEVQSLESTDSRVQAVVSEWARIGRNKQEAGLYLLLPAGTGWRASELWPLFMVGGAVQKNPQVGPDPGLETASNVFWRVQKKELYFDPHGDEAVIRRGGPAELIGYRRRFQNPPEGVHDYENDFWAEIEQEARVFAGRRDELNLILQRLQEAVAAHQSRVLFFTGEAGRGKSALMGQVALVLAAESPERRYQQRPILVHRFRAGDRRNNWRAFVVLGLKQLTGREPEKWTINELGRAGGQLANEIAKHKPLLLLDGLDELARVEPEAIDELRELSGRGGLWLCSSRPDPPDRPGPVHALLEMGAERIRLGSDPDGQLPPLGQSDMRAIILNRGSALICEELLRFDEELPERPGIASNQLLENLERLGGNQPQYLQVWLEYLEGLSGRTVLLQKLQGAARRRVPELPDGLKNLYQEVLDRLGVGETETYKTPALYMLAQAGEPLDARMLSELYRNQPEVAEKRLRHFEQALNLFSLVLEPATDSDGVEGARIANASFRDFLPIATSGGQLWVDAQQDLARAALSPWRYPHAGRHLYRYGIAYLLVAGQLKKAISQLRNKRYLERKIVAWDDRTIGVLGLVMDHAWVANALKADGRFESRELGDIILRVISRRLGEEDPRTLVAETSLAITLLKVSDFEGARRLQERALEIYRRILGEGHADTLTEEHNLATIVAEQGKSEDAKQLQERVLEISRRVLGDEHQATLRAESNLAVIFQELRQWQDARRLQETSAEVSRRVLGEENPDTLIAESNLAATLVALGQYEDARLLAEKVAKVQRRVLGEEHPDTLSTEGILAAALGHLNHLEDALRLEERVLEVSRRVLGEEHSDTLTVEANLVSTLHSLKRYEDARRLGERLVDVSRRVLGEEHPKTLDAEGNLALMFQEIGHYEDARQLHERRVKIFRRVLGAEHRDTLIAESHLGTTLDKLGHFEEARQLQEGAAEVYRRVLGEEHPETLVAECSLAWTLGKLKRYEDARQLGEKVVEVSRRVLGEEHEDTLWAEGNLAAIFRGLRQYENARRLQERVEEISRRVLGEEDPKTLTAEGNLALTLQEMGRLEDALRLGERLAGVSRRVRGDRHRETLAAEGNLALTLKKLGRLGEARRLEERVLEVRRNMLGEAHPDTLVAETNLAYTLKRLGQSEDARSE
jgi:tetratricopeptide (TPR) repeat protein